MRDKMKLVWLSAECPYPPNTGGRMVTWKRIEKLSRQHEIVLLSVIDADDEHKYKSNIENYCKEVYFFQRKKSIGIYVHSMFKPYPAVSRWSKEFRRKLEEVCLNFAPDYVVIDFPQMYGNLSKKVKKNFKIILNQHNIEYLTMKNIAKAQENVLKKTMFSMVSQQMKKYENKIYKENSIFCYTFVSKTDKDFFEKSYKKKNTYLFPIGCEPKMSCLPENKKTIAFIANYSYMPNSEGALWFLSHVWQKIQESIPDAVLSLVGKGPSEYLRQEAKKYNNVIVTGAVKSVEKDYYENNIIIVPLFSGGGAKVKLIEALGYGKIVVSTTEGARGTDFTHGEELFITDEANQFASYCIEAMLNPEAYEAMRMQAFEKVTRQYSWDKIVSDFDEFLKNKDEYSESES